jgi:hypothetical protein
VNQPNKEGQPSAEVGEGRAQTIGEHRSITHAPDTERDTHVPGIARCAARSPLFIHRKSRMRKRARTDLRGGRSAMVVPTATVILAPLGRRSLGRVVGLSYVPVGRHGMEVDPVRVMDSGSLVRKFPGCPCRATTPVNRQGPR